LVLFNPSSVSSDCVNPCCVTVCDSRDAAPPLSLVQAFSFSHAPVVPAFYTSWASPCILPHQVSMHVLPIRSFTLPYTSISTPLFPPSTTFLPRLLLYYSPRPPSNVPPLYHFRSACRRCSFRFPTSPIFLSPFTSCLEFSIPFSLQRLLCRLSPPIETSLPVLFFFLFFFASLYLGSLARGDWRPFLRLLLFRIAMV